MKKSKNKKRAGPKIKIQVSDLQRNEAEKVFVKVIGDVKVFKGKGYFSLMLPNGMTGENYMGWVRDYKKDLLSIGMK